MDFENFPTMQIPPIQKEDEFILVLAEYAVVLYRSAGDV